MSEQSVRLSQAVVGCILQKPELLADALQSITASDFDPPYAQTITALSRLQADGAPHDPWVIQEAIERTYPGLPHNFVADTALHGNVAAFDYYLSQFREGIARRRLHGLADVVSGVAAMEDLRLGFQRAREALADAEGGLIPQALPLVDADCLWDYSAPPESVLIPGLLWRQGRVMITGHEGGGKSIVLRQLAMAGALGIHPFRPHQRIEPIRTLYLDLENPASLAQSIMRSMLDTLRALGCVNDCTFSGRMKFDIRTEGIDIVGRGRDREYVTRAIATHRPDLVCIGPVYRMAHGGGDLDESTVGGVIDYLNHLRATYDVAIVTEAHPPHGATDGNDGNARRVLRPSGSSAWMRFPEVGRGLRFHKPASDLLRRSVYRMEDWRGDRSPDMRFPTYVARQTQGRVWYDDCTEEVQAMTR